jgi:hypothetical protein
MTASSDAAKRGGNPDGMAARGTTIAISRVGLGTSGVRTGARRRATRLARAISISSRGTLKFFVSPSKSRTVASSSHETASTFARSPLIDAKGLLDFRATEIGSASRCATGGTDQALAWLGAAGFETAFRALCMSDIR